VIVTACDDNYVRGAAATIRSAIDNLPRERPAAVYVLDGGISEASKAKLLASWKRPNLTVQWLAPQLDLLRDMPVSDHISLATYLRLLLAELLPGDVQKAIYLDADTIVLHSLDPLWQTDLAGAYCAAAQDAYVPVLDPHIALSHPLHCMTLAGVDPRPITNYQQLYLSPHAAYFNAGVMLVNVARWRQENVARRALECLRHNAAHVRWWDQYALNVLFSQQWTPLDPRWNQNSHVFRIRSWQYSHYSEAELDLVRSAPWIIHFDATPKPWDADSEHPLRHHFFRYLDRTAWRGWRPPQTITQRWQRLHAAYRSWRRDHYSPAVRHLKRRLLGKAA
jgi:lipopolysaccharide biosynthesis glycosyltransferase